MKDNNISNIVAQLAQANGINVKNVSGSGQNGRVLKSDVQALIKGVKPEEAVKPAEEKQHYDQAC